jgi:hypothetical protein
LPPYLRYKPSQAMEISAAWISNPKMVTGEEREDPEKREPFRRFKVP